MNEIPLFFVIHDSAFARCITVVKFDFVFDTAFMVTSKRLTCILHFALDHLIV